MDKNTDKRLVWTSTFGGSRAYTHTITWHDINSEVPQDAARGYNMIMNTDRCKLLLLVEVKKEGETYLELEQGWYDAKIDRNNIIVNKDMDGRVIAYAFVQALEPIRVFNIPEIYETNGRK